MRTPAAARIDIDPTTPDDEVADLVRAWVAANVPATWRTAADRGGAAAIREVRSREDYESWYPVFGWSGLVAPTWPVEYGGLGVSDRRPAPIDNACALTTSAG